MTKVNRVRAALVLLLWCQSLPAVEAQWQDRPLREFIAAITLPDRAILYSSDLVLPDYTVIDEPISEDPISALREALAPYNLLLANGPNGSFLIVRLTSNSPAIEITVLDSTTNRGIASAIVFLDGNRSGATSRNGRVTLADQQPGIHLLKVTATGYIASEPGEIVLQAGQTMSISIRLQPLPRLLEEIVVTSSLYHLDYDPAGSHTFLDRELTDQLPDVGDDAVRSIQRLPGVASGGVSSRSHVRGGSENEQLFLFDGLRLYEPYHLKDFQALSTIVDRNAMSGLDLYSAGYQARYGDRMSSVIDISMREPATETTTELALSFFSASALSMGRFGGSDKGDWLATARRGNLDLMADAINPDYGSPRYEDALLHIGWQLGEHTYVSANTILSYDKISINEIDGTERANAKYRNRIVWFKAVTDWTTKLSSSTILSATEIDNDRSGINNTPGVVAGNVTDIRDFRSVALRQDWHWNAADTWSIKSGFDIKHVEASYRYDSSLQIFSPFDQILNNVPLETRSIRSQPRGAQYAAYAESRWQPIDKLIFDLGIRWDQQTYTIADNDDQTSLRFNLLYYLDDRTELRIGAGRFYQAQEINELQVMDGVETFFPAQRASHLIASISHEFRSGLDIRFEIYRKKYRSLMTRYENIFDPLVLLPELQIDRFAIDADAADSRGAEVTISSESENILWWMSYAWSRSEDLFFDDSVKRSWDQPSAFKGGVTWNWERWNLSVAGTVNSGWPRTDLLLETTNDAGGSTALLTTSARNYRRHPTFNTFDARISRRFKLPRGELTAFLEVINIYNQSNECCTEYSLQTDGDGNQILLANDGNWLPLLPSLGVVWRF